MFGNPENVELSNNVDKFLKSRRSSVRKTDNEEQSQKTKKGNGKDVRDEKKSKKVTDSKKKK